METTTVRDFYNRILGYIEEQHNGDKTARDFYRRILGRYDKKANVTRDFYGRIISKGDTTMGLILNNAMNDSKK